MLEPTADSIGKRIARARKRRALTQQGLALRSNYSRSHISQVEAGHKVATPAFIAATAAALGVDPSELYGQPFRGETARYDAVHVPIPDIRRALAFVDIAPELEAPPRSLDQLTAELSTCQRLRRAARHVQLGARLPAVLEELTWHAHEAEEPRAWRLLWRAHEAAGELTRRLGYNDLANQILERETVAALRSQDPHLPLMVARRRALLMTNVAAFGPARKLLRQAISKVDPSHDGAEEAAGSLHLRAAIISARAGDDTAAWDHYGHAAEISHRAGRSLDAYNTNFVPGNVAIHGAAVAVELCDFDEATRRDRGIGERLLSGLSPERRAHHEIDMSRVHVETTDHDRALSRLVSADRTAPQMTRYHPTAKAIASYLADVYRGLPEPLRGLLSHMHIA